MTPTNSNEGNQYAGMSCNGIEFFQNNNDLFAIHNRKIIAFTELPFGIVQLLKEEIEQHPEVKMALHDMHPISEYKRIEQFARCRFGGLDFHPDIKNNVLQEGEYWPCPLHGKCESEEILCKLPSYKGQRLTNADVKMMQHLSTEETNEAIAEDLDYTLGSFHKIKQQLYKKLGIQTKPTLALITRALNLI